MSVCTRQNRKKISEPRRSNALHLPPSSGKSSESSQSEKTSFFPLSPFHFVTKLTDRRCKKKKKRKSRNRTGLLTTTESYTVSAAARIFLKTSLLSIGHRRDPFIDSLGRIVTPMACFSLSPLFSAFLFSWKDKLDRCCRPRVSCSRRH